MVKASILLAKKYHIQKNKVLIGHTKISSKWMCWAAPHRPARPVLAQLQTRKNPGIGDRDIRWGSSSDTPPWAADSRQDKAVVFPTTGRGSLPVVGELILGWLINCQGNYHSGDSSDLTIRTVTSWGQGEFSSVAQWCPILCDPIDCSMPGLLVHHRHPELTQTHVHRVDDTSQPSHPLFSPSPPAFNLSQHQGLFQWVSSSHQVIKLQILEFQL